MEEQAEATEELIAMLTENHTRQMEALIKSTMEVMKEMMQLVKNQSTPPTNATKTSYKEKKKKCDCRCRFSGKPISTYMSLTLARLCGEWRNGVMAVLA
jgi:hypothetical protein